MKLTAKVLSVALVLFVTLSFVPGFGLRAFAADPSATPAHLNLVTNGTGTVTLDAGDEGYAYSSYTGGDGLTVTVSENTATIAAGSTAGDPQTITFTFTKSGEDNKTATCTVQVFETEPSVTVANKDATVGTSTTTMQATTNPTGQTVTWSIDPAVTGFSIDSSTGAVTVDSSVADGTQATAKATMTVNGLPVTGTGTITAKEATTTVNVTSVKLKDGTTELTEGQEIEVAKGSNKTLTPVVTVTPDESANKGVTWSIDPEDTKVTLANGTVTVTDNATVGDVYTITATSEKDTSQKATCKVKVKAASSTTQTPTTSYTMSEVSRSAPLYARRQNDYKLNDLVTIVGNGSDTPEYITGVSSNASIDGNNLKINSIGDLTITATGKDNSSIKGSITLKPVVGFIEKQGKDSVYTKGSNKNLPFKIVNSDSNLDSKTFERFESARITGQASANLTKGTDYVVKAGSVDITLLSPFLETLAPGDYYLIATFNVPDQLVNGVTIGLVDSEPIHFKVVSAGSGSNPSTNDYLYVGLGIFMFLLALTYVALFTYDKKQRKLRLRRRRMAHRRYY